MTIIKQGAEAVISMEAWHGRDAVVKERGVKRYRLKELDDTLRNRRLKNEARLMHQARMIGVPVPMIYDVDIPQCRLVMEFIDGEQLKDILKRGDGESYCMELGSMVGKLHSAGVVHGDLTTSNILVRNERLYMIDFSLGEKTKEEEKMGVDLHLLKEALESAHSEFRGFFDEVLAGYLESFEGAERIINVMEAIEKRGRYK